MNTVSTSYTVAGHARVVRSNGACSLSKGTPSPRKLRSAAVKQAVLPALSASQPPFARPRALLARKPRGRSCTTWASSEFDAYSEGSDSAELSAEDKVQWVPSKMIAKPAVDILSLSDQAGEAELAGDGKEYVLPCFPLGSHVYMPGKTHELRIFEPRYRAMYNDILFNGSRRFVVPFMHPSEGLRFGEAAVVFYLEDLKEVSEETGDQIKYECQHKITGRVRIKRTVNPEALTDRSTYLKVVVEDLEDEDEDVGSPEVKLLEADVSDMFNDVIRLQYDLDETVKFNKNIMDTMGVGPGEDEFDKNLWRVAALWQQFLHERIGLKRAEVSAQIHQVVLSYLEEEGVEVTKDMMIDITELPENVQQAIMRIQTEYQNQAQAELDTATYPFQELVQASKHTDRLELLRSMLEAEQSMLKTKAQLKAMFNSDA